MAVRKRLELLNRLSPIDGLAIRSNTIMGPHLEFGPVIYITSALFPLL